ncbi:MAG: hypothetical protein M3281_07400 [Chloroflexota bacterium]|nr:hypothetical protein [Chloroflexota bacterium]
MSRLAIPVPTLRRAARAATVAAAVLAMLFVFNRPASGQEATPGATTTPAAPAGTPTPIPTAPPGVTSEETTVAGVSGNLLTINKPGGKLETITVGTGVVIIRGNQPATVDTLEATDRVIIRRDKSGKLQSIFAIPAPAATAAPTVLPTRTVGPSATTTAGPARTAVATGTPGSRVYTGSISDITGAIVSIAGDDGTSRQIDTARTPGLAILHNGNRSAVSDLKPGDAVDVTYAANNQPTRLEARTLETAPNSGGLNRIWILYALLLVAPFLLLLLPLLDRRRSRPSVLQRRQGD